MLKNHEGVYIREEMEGELLNEKYLTKEYTYNYIPGFDREYDYTEFITDDLRYSLVSGEYVCYLPITPEGVSDYASYRAEKYASFLDSEILDQIIESVIKKDGRITVKTVLCQKALEDLAEHGVTGGKFEYVLDEKTRELISIIGDYTYADGSTSNSVIRLSYDAEVSAALKELLESVSQTEDLRNITIISNPGTEKEEAKSIQAPKGLVIGLRYDGDSAYNFEPYTDATCTTSYDPYADTDSDLTIYVKWNG